ncbi:MAG: sodium:calcium antiporter [Deltaproteobacteria bacterium]|nr:sodium:calcium antiporter [Deltaproteobacteria bacterium]
MPAWLIFLLSAGVIVIAGTQLSRYGDQIAELTGLGGLWIGMVLMAGATSLPELLTDIFAIWLHAPDLAVGDLFGSNMANMLILAIIDLLYREKRVWHQAAYEQALTAALAIALTGVAGLFILSRSNLQLWGVGLGSTVIAIIYLSGIRVVYRQEDMRRRQRERERIVEAEERGPDAILSSRGQLKRASIGFAIAALGIVLAAPFLATSAKTIAEETGIGMTFIGTSLVAAATSLPELVSSLAAVRLGAFDLAVGNLFGSNAFNMALLFLLDVVHHPDPLLSVVSVTHTVAALLGIVLMSIGLMGIIYRAERRFLLIEPDSALMILSYAAGMWALFRLGGG